MKRPLITIGLVVLAVILVRGAELILERGLDTYLPPLLTEKTGATTVISPIRADIFTLTAKAETYQMGDPDNPALIAKDVKVSLDWTDLLSGEIRLVTGSGRDLMVNISLWPSDDEPRSQDYLFLEQWLPKKLELETGRYVREDGSRWEIHTATWERFKDDSAKVAWQETHPAGEVSIEGKLSSLDDLLALRLFEIDVSMDSDQEQLPPTRFSWRIEPGDQDTAYEMKFVGELAGMPGTIEAEGIEPWSFPDRSKTVFDEVQVKHLIELITLFVADGVEDDLEQELLAELPAMGLPIHEGELSIGELHFGKDMTHDNEIDFNSSGRHLALTRVGMKGLYADLDGYAAIQSDDGAWSVNLSADINARETDKGLMGRYLESEWNLREGTVRLKSKGSTWGEILDSTEGSFDLTGAHHGAVITPISFAASLDGTPTKFALDDARMVLGESIVTGSVAFSGGRERTLAFIVDSERLDARFLFADPNTDPLPGLALPEVLTLFPGIDVTWDGRVAELVLPSFEVRNVELDVDRGTQRGRVRFSARGFHQGGIEVFLNYEESVGDNTRVHMRIDLDETDIDRLFGEEQGLLESRTSGSIVLNSEGDDLEKIFTAMRGDADLTVDFRDDADWVRESRPEEQLGMSGNAQLVVSESRILGVELSNLSIDSIDQDVRGTFSVVDGRDPFFIAELTSERFNLARVLNWFPKSTEAADEADLLQAMRLLGAGQLTVRIGELTYLKHPLRDLVLKIDSDSDLFSVERLDFTYLDARVESKAAFHWQDEQATLEADGKVSALVLNDFIDAHGGEEQLRLDDPMTGSFVLAGEGKSLTEIAGGLSGEIKLAAKPPSKKLVDIDLVRIDRGVEADINALRWAGSELTGKVRYLNTNPATLDIDLTGGVLDLRPWEDAYFEAAESAQGDEATSTVGKAAENTGQFARDFLSYPARLLGDSEGTPPGERIFSSEPIDLESFHAVNLSLKGDIGALHSRVAEATDLKLNVGLRGGILTIDTQAGKLNGGPVSVTGKFDSTTLPPSAELDFWVDGMYSNPDQSTYPRYGHAILTSTGTSQAELAGNLNGMGYIEFGQGIIDYRGLRILTADAATSMFRALIPTVNEDNRPKLQCGITLADFTNGTGVTPYGWAARTRTANLLGAIEVDLKKEQLQLRFRSRSREGVGISIGNAFSNSVDIEGPLSDPRIVPNTPGLIVRGWAAFLTAGLSVVGESVFNRVLASGNPCKDIIQEIRKDLCISDAPLASSHIACPSEEVAANRL